MALTLFMQPLTKLEPETGNGTRGTDTGAQDNNGFGNSLVGFTFTLLLLGCVGGRVEIKRKRE